MSDIIHTIENSESIEELENLQSWLLQYGKELPLWDFIFYNKILKTRIEELKQRSIQSKRREQFTKLKGENNVYEDTLH